MNPCRAHFLRVTAALEAAASDPGTSMEGATSYELQLHQLIQDRLRLKQVQSNQAKAELKRQLLVHHADYVQGVIEAGRGAQDEVVTTVMLWRIDAGDYPGALDVVAYVLQHGLPMPDRFNRTTGCLVAEEIAEAALKAQKAGDTFPLAILHRTAELTEGQDMPDEVRAKLLLATGRATLQGLTEDAPGQPGQIQAGIDLLKSAIDRHSTCGGKKDLDGAERLLKKHTERQEKEHAATGG
ncbi:terminase endonuclease subunit [Pseudomonas sp. RIT-PI-AD]|uniref:phage terminase small subunit n=1 Tax=Pseudomonas sp. RIT-PI-AD TaxID=3035294 RepID=UPI0021D9D64E|nr:terminase endonuclease subunit [Pseudomonas sp. RIT-PI-AD]